MNSYKQSGIFLGLFIVIALVMRFYGVYRAEVEIPLSAVIVNCLGSGVVAGVGFYIGQSIVKEYLMVKHLVFSALFAFMMSHTLSRLIGLYEISWFAYAGSVLLLSGLIAMRAPKMFRSEKYS